MMPEYVLVKYTKLYHIILIRYIDFDWMKRQKKFFREQRCRFWMETRSYTAGPAEKDLR
jgi:hypothetical protein